MYNDYSCVPVFGFVSIPVARGENSQGVTVVICRFNLTPPVLSAPIKCLYLC